MSGNGLNVTLGTCNGTAVAVDISGGLRGTPETAVFVTLSADYIRDTVPPGYPDTPQGYVGGVATELGGQRTIPSGTRLSLLEPEAAAVVATGGASYS